MQLFTSMIYFEVNLYKLFANLPGFAVPVRQHFLAIPEYLQPPNQPVRSNGRVDKTFDFKMVRVRYFKFYLNEG